MIILLINVVLGAYHYDQNTHQIKPDQPNHPDFGILLEGTVIVTQETPTQLDIRIEDAKNELFRFPDIEPFKSVFNDIRDPPTYEKYEYEVLIHPLFNVTVLRQDTQECILQLSDLLMTQYYQEFTLKIPTEYFFGLGERNQKGFRFKEGIYTLYAKDVPELIENGKPPGKNVYSSQPVYLMKEKSGKYHVFFFKNPSAIDVIYHEDTLKFKYIGGIPQIKIFLGDYHPETAIKLYHKYLGGWALQPFWAMGYHHSRWPIRDSKELKRKVELHINNSIPLDTIWSDIDYMNDRQIFSVDENKFLKQDLIEIQQKVHYIPIIDVGVGVKYGKQDKGFREGINLDIFLRSPAKGTRLRGRVWPGPSYYPDFFHPNCSIYWKSMIEHLYNQTTFSGLWIDMNEPTNFCDGECTRSGWNHTFDYEDENISYKNQPIRFPYTPGESPLDKMTLPPHLKHYGGYLHKDVHNLYGFQESYETYHALKKIGKPLPFIISRSTFAGSGRFTQHWFGDNAATFDFMYISVGQMFQFGIYGIPFGGADVCGFLQNTTEKLCQRWSQLGSIYPFFRNHNNDQARDQEFYSFTDELLLTARKNIKLRYSLIRWYYSVYIRQNHTGTVFKPLFYEFQADHRLLQDDVLDTQIMLGSEIMATPILVEGITIRKAYFPQSGWYHLLSGARMQKENDLGSEHFILCRYTDFIPLFIRGGSIVVRQDVAKVQTTKDLNNHYYIVAALNMNKAEGVFIDVTNYEDETISNQCEQNNCLLDINLRVEPNNIILTIVRNQDKKPSESQLFIGKLKIYGLPKVEIEKCESQLAVQCESEDSYYPYNTVVSFNSGIGLEFGQITGVYEIIIKF